LTARRTVKQRRHRFYGVRRYATAATTLTLVGPGERGWLPVPLSTLHPAVAAAEGRPSIAAIDKQSCEQRFVTQA